MRAFRWAVNWRVGLWLVLSLTTCTDTNPPPEPAAFERPNRVGFVCVDRAQPSSSPSSLVPLERCSTLSLAAPPPNTDYVLHALVTQSSRGEVAAVELRPSRYHIVDTRPDIPGPTFVPVGELPTAIAVSETQPRLTYVANAASRDLSVVQTSALVQVASGVDVIDRVPLRPTPDADPGIPFDMLLSPDADALFVSSAESGWLLRIPLQRCPEGETDCAAAGQPDLSAAVKIPIEQSWSKLSPDAFSAPARSDEPYQFTCPKVAPNPLPIPNAPLGLPQPGDDVGTPAPAGLALDAFCEAGACRRRLLVADKTQPIIHAIDIDLLAQGMTDDAVLAPILTGTPTERVAVSPRVPAAVQSDEDTQYVYAIDARNGSVLVAQDDRIRNVNADPSQPADRLELGAALGATGPAVALSLAVITPDFDPNGPANQWLTAPATLPDFDPLACLDSTHTVRSPSRLRGVFLAVGLTDGTVRIINVHDMELRDCRTCDPEHMDADDESPAESVSYVASLTGYDPVLRHRPRLLYGYTPDNNGDIPAFSPWVSPQFFVSGTQIGVRADGTTNDPRVTGLECVSCSATQAIAFPTPDQIAPAGDAGVDAGAQVTDAGVSTIGSTCGENEGRVCMLADPTLDPANWRALYEGAIPGTRGGHGVFLGVVSGGVEFSGDPDFCKAGVLGDDELPAGDQLQITSPLPSQALRDSSPDGALDEQQAQLCNQLVSARDDDQEAIAFRIRRAYVDQLLIDPRLYRRPGSQLPEATWEDVKRCFAGTALTYEVHTRDTYIVQRAGDDVGFDHSVIRQAGSDRCIKDPAQPEQLGRVRPGGVFDNGFIKFAAAAVSEPLTELALGVVDNAPKILLNATNLGSGSVLRGVMPVDLRYNSGNSTMYAIDITTRGLIPVSFDPMPSVVIDRNTVQ